MQKKMPTENGPEPPVSDTQVNVAMVVCELRVCGGRERLAAHQTTEKQESRLLKHVYVYM